MRALRFRDFTKAEEILQRLKVEDPLSVQTRGAEFEESWRINSHWKTRQWIAKTMTQLGNFDEAESLLMGMVSDHPRVQLDMAWMYERRGELHRATECLRSFRRLFPDDEYSRLFLEKLRARMMSPSGLIEEVRN